LMSRKLRRSEGLSVNGLNESRSASHGTALLT
jgi:hypothetical protein